MAIHSATKVVGFLAITIIRMLLTTVLLLQFNRP